MVKKRIDNRIRVLIENCVAAHQRSMFVVVGDKGKDQVVILHHMLSKAAIKARPTILWCYKKELGFSSHRKKRMKQLQKKIKYGKLEAKEDDPFELFVASTNIRYCYYNETHKILGNTFGMVVLQDFEAMTPNLLARTVETVEGGGIVVILLRTMSSLKQFYTMAMDVHSRFRTESHQNIVARFNERFLLSLTSCNQCIVVDDQLNILPISNATLHIEPVAAQVNDELKENESTRKLNDLKESLAGTQPAHSLISLCKTLDQAKCVLKFIDTISEKTLRTTISLTASRGRGKSAALGLSIACACAYGYSNIFVTSPTPENLKTLFEFILKGFDALNYQEHVDYDIIQSTNPDFNKAIVRVNVFRDHRQTIQYINPKDYQQLSQAELLVIDEAAAIPLPLVKSLFGPYLVFLSSTINGYEGTGRSLSLKLIQQLRQQSGSVTTNIDQKRAATNSKILHELQLNESIRYANGDCIEKWLNDLLCLNCNDVLVNDCQYLKKSCPIPDACDLYYINRDTLFSYHKISEIFLQHLMALYVSSHYKNTPNDLQMLSDAPAHHIFCLLPPFDNLTTTNGAGKLPEILCVVQICLEGEISEENLNENLKRGRRANGDLIPWTITQQYQDDNFSQLLGGRIIRIATHPDYQHMGYGSRALKLLEDYYKGNIVDLTEKNGKHEEESGIEEEIDNVQDLELLTESIKPRKNLPPLLLKLNERKAEKLDYLGVSYGLTNELLKFWKRSQYIPVYLRQTANDLTGEHSCIMLKDLVFDPAKPHDSWLYQYFIDFRKRFLSLLGYEFRIFLPSMCLNVVEQKLFNEDIQLIKRSHIESYFSNYDVKRLEMYSQNLVDYHLIMDLIPNLSRLYFLNKLGPDFKLSLVQQVILVGMGLQFKSIDSLEKDLDLPSNQILALFNKVIKKLIQLIDDINVNELGMKYKANEDNAVDVLGKMKPLKETLAQELNEAAKDVLRNSNLKLKNIEQYAVKGSEKDWTNALNLNQTSTASSYVTIKRMTEKRKVDFESHFDSTDTRKTKSDRTDVDVDDKDKKGKKFKNNNNSFKKKKKDKFFKTKS